MTSAKSLCRGTEIGIVLNNQGPGSCSAILEFCLLPFYFLVTFHLNGKFPSLRLGQLGVDVSAFCWLYKHWGLWILNSKLGGCIYIRLYEGSLLFFSFHLHLSSPHSIPSATYWRSRERLSVQQWVGAWLWGRIGQDSNPCFYTYSLCDLGHAN